jgi:hypothetical protein
MWRVQLSCDGCQVTVEATHQGSNYAVALAKHAARDDGWEHKVNRGWFCPSCHAARAPALIGECAEYIGGIIALKGHRVRIVKRDEVEGVVHAVFVDPSCGRWAQQPHWFFISDFQPEVCNAENGLNGSGSGLGEAQTRAAGA